MEAALFIARGSLFHIDAAEILKDIFVICSRHRPSSSLIGYHMNSQLFSMMVALIHRKVGNYTLEIINFVIKHTNL